MPGILRRADLLLRADPQFIRGGSPTRRTAVVLMILILFGLLYGAAMGSFGGVQGGRAWQILYSAVKVPVLLEATFVLSVVFSYSVL